MCRIVNLILLFILGFGSISAQSFTIVPEKNIDITGDITIPTHTGVSYLTTTSNSSVYLKWKKIEEDVPTSWHLFICDNKFCYTNFPDSANLDPIDSGEQQEMNRMKLYVEPNGVTGTGRVKVVINDLNDPLNTDTITYFIDITFPAAVENHYQEENQIELFPSPSFDKISIRTIKKASFIIYNTTGEIVSPSKELNSDTLTEVDISYLPSGQYFILFEQGKTQTYKKLLKVD